MEKQTCLCASVYVCMYVNAHVYVCTDRATKNIWRCLKIEYAGVCSRWMPVCVHIECLCMYTLNAYVVHIGCLCMHTLDAYVCTRWMPVYVHIECLCMYTLDAYVCTRWMPMYVHVGCLCMHTLNACVYTLDTYVCIRLSFGRTFPYECMYVCMYIYIYIYITKLSMLAGLRFRIFPMWFGRWCASIERSIHMCRALCHELTRLGKSCQSGEITFKCTCHEMRLWRVWECSLCICEKTVFACM